MPLINLLLLNFRIRLNHADGKKLCNSELVKPLEEEGIAVPSTGTLFSNDELIIIFSLEFDEDLEFNFTDFIEYACQEISVRLAEYGCYVNNYSAEFG